MKKSFTAIIILLLVSVPGFLHAQIGKDPADTLQEYFDTVKVETTPAQDDTVVDEDEQTTSNDEEKKPDYFLPKWMPGGGYDTLQLRHISDSQKTKMSRDESFWYANYIFNKKKPENQQPDKPKSGSNPFTGLVWILIIAGFVAFLVLYLNNSNVKLFRSSKTVADDEEAPETDDIFAINYQKEIDKAITAGNYRLATRLLYLRLLRRLAEKNVIQYSQEKTNFDYLMQIRSTVWYKPFFTLTRHYEFVWYGLFDVDSARFNIINNDFAELENQL